MGLIHLRKGKMRVWSAISSNSNATLFILTKLGTFDISSIIIKREFSFMPSIDYSYTSAISAASWFNSKNDHFLEPKKQTALYHSNSLLSIPKYDSETGGNGKRKYRQKRQNERTDSLPIFLVPGLTSFFFYSTNQKSALFTEAAKFNISTGVYCLPKTEEIPKKGKNCTPLGCGEDSFCVAENDHELVLAVADGVGGWRKKGVDPAIFSQTLMHHAAEIAKSPDEKLKFDANGPKTIIRDAFWRLVDDFTTGKKKPFGSSTVCVVMINKDTGRLKFGNLGDSGFIIMSPIDTVEGLGTKYRIKYKSESQQHRFNMPYQITLAPPYGKVSDTSDLAATDATLKPPKEISVEAGDIVLLVTDGVLDNIFDDELEDLISNSIKTHSRKHSATQVPQLVAQDLAFKARAFSEDSRRESPFTVEARKHNLNYLGGKEDDITVIAAIIYPKFQK